MERSLFEDLSLNQRQWTLAEADDQAVAILAQRYQLPEFVARLLVQRQVSPEKVQDFLNPTLRNGFPDPFSLKGMEAFARDMAQAIITREPIGIFADFDVDGSTSAAILSRFFRHFGMEPPVYIPDRLNEGYGPSVPAMQILKAQGVRHVIMADCGITAFEPIAAAVDMGLKISVFDHHEPEGNLPPATHIINPKLLDCASGLSMLAACGVTFLSCVAINNILREQGAYQNQTLTEPPLKSWLDLVALGTVCDMVPLTGCNRLFVRAGFEQMAQRNNPGIRALCEVEKIETVPDPKDAGWSLGPRINAGSRVHKSDIGAKLLSTDDYDQALSYAWALEECNQERKKIQGEMMQRALNIIEFIGGQSEDFIFVADETFHQGMSGLVAGRLKERYQKPAIVVAYADLPDGTRECRGSGRSITGVNMAEIFIAARNDGVLLKGGGHAMAGGFAVLPEKIDEFKHFIAEHLRKKNDKPQAEALRIDSLASIRGARLEFIKMVTEQMGPFGMGNPEPVFLLPDIRIHQIDVLKDQHLRLMMSDAEGGTRMKAMAFGAIGTPLGDSIVKSYRAVPFHLTGQFQINRWQGRESVEFHVMDALSASSASLAKAV